MIFDGSPEGVAGMSHMTATVQFGGFCYGNERVRCINHHIVWQIILLHHKGQ